MRIVFFYLLFVVLTADGLMIFLIPVIVYQLTTSIEYAGLTYALWWLPRLFLIPLIGNSIDNLGIRLLAVLTDSVKIMGCLFLIIMTFSSNLMIAISFGLIGSLIAIGNSQILISYEKLIALKSNYREHHINIMSRIDFLGMIIGPLIGMLLIDIGYKVLLFIPIIFYFMNALFFLFFYRDEVEEKYLRRQITAINNKKMATLNENIIYIFSTPILMFSILIAMGNNMFDGLVESSGAALIDQAMELPIKYYGFIDVAAGLCGVLGTYLYSYLNQYTGRALLLVFSISLIILSSTILVMIPDSIWVFITCYAISIIGKVFTGNIFRILRIEIIPTQRLASISSLIILFNQLILPLVGAGLFLISGTLVTIYLLMMISIMITLLGGCLLISRLLKENKKTLQ